MSAKTVIRSSRDDCNNFNRITHQFPLVISSIYQSRKQFIYAVYLVAGKISLTKLKNNVSITINVQNKKYNKNTKKHLYGHK